MTETLIEPSIRLTCDSAINLAFQQNAIPIVKELVLQNNGVARKDLSIRISSEPAFAVPMTVRLQSIVPDGEFRLAPLDIKLSPTYLFELHEKVSGLLKVEVSEGENIICTHTESISLLAQNEWCGLVCLPEILGAFVLPNDQKITVILDRASELLKEATGRSALNGYQDKSRKRAWEQLAAIYKAIGELGIRYINPPASFENSGQKVRFPSDVLAQRFATCLDLSLLFASCCEAVGLRPLVFIHEGHAYGGCWLDERSMAEPASDDLQYIRKLETDSVISVFETTLVCNERPGTLKDAEFLAQSHLQTKTPFKLALDVNRARAARILPLPIPGQKITESTGKTDRDQNADQGLGDREFSNDISTDQTSAARVATRIDQWKNRLLDLSLRNRLLNFRETKSTVHILTAAPEAVEDELAAERELALRPKPKMMGENDPRSGIAYTQEQRNDALLEQLREELGHGRLHSDLDESEHFKRLTEIYRSARNAIDENGTNTLFVAVGFLEWRETDLSDRIFRAPLLLVPVELKRKSVIEGFSLKRIDEDTRLNVTLMEMLRQNFRKEIAGLEPLPEDHSGVNVARVFQLFREAVRDMPGWEVKTEIWLGQFSFTKFLLWKDLADRLEALAQNRLVHHLINNANKPYPNPSEDIEPSQLDDRFHPREIFCPRSADSSQLSAVMAAAAGHDFVLEGPPGTGKSQTITNIIAHCLADGKRVLFVAEKKAALDVVHRRLKEDGLDPFCLELHSNKTGKAEVVAQFDRTLKFVGESSVQDWEQRAAELERLRDSLNHYTRALHKRYPCGLSAYHCLDYLLPRQSEATVRLDEWSTILATSNEKLEDARRVAHVLQERSRSLVPLADHPLASLSCQEWSPSWAERIPERIRNLEAITKTAGEATREVRRWLQCPSAAVSKAELEGLDALLDSLEHAQPVGAAFATTPWSQLSTDLTSWINFARERFKLRESLAGAQETMGQGLPCEKWAPVETTEILRQCEILARLTADASAATRVLLEGFLSPELNASRTKLAQLFAVVDSLLDPAQVESAFATTLWADWSEEFERWITLIRERKELRDQLKDYEESQLTGLDLAALANKWQSAKNAWFLPKWLSGRAIRNLLRTVRRDQARPEVTALDSILTAALRLKAINDDLATQRPLAESLLGAMWKGGERDADTLEAIRNWGENLHGRIDSLTEGNENWRLQLRHLIGTDFANGPDSYKEGTSTGNRYAHYRDAIVQFESAYEESASRSALNRSKLDESPDHLSAVSTALARIIQDVPPLRVINDEFSKAAPKSQACLGALWASGEPSPETLELTRTWGSLLHTRIVACAGDDLAWLGQLRSILGTLFVEGPEISAPGTPIGNRLSKYRAATGEFRSALDSLAIEISLNRRGIDESPDFFNAILILIERLAGGWPKIREWCSWQKARQEGVSLGLTPVITKLESPKEGGDLPAFFERSFRRAFLFAAIEKEQALREFFGSEHLEKIGRFREVDQKVASLTRSLIRARLSANVPRDSNRFDQIPQAEIGLLSREIGKKCGTFRLGNCWVGSPISCLDSSPVS